MGTLEALKNTHAKKALPSGTLLSTYDITLKTDPYPSEVRSKNLTLKSRETVTFRRHE